MLFQQKKLVCFSFVGDVGISVCIPFLFSGVEERHSCIVQLQFVGAIVAKRHTCI